MATYEIIRETHGEATCLATTLGGQRWWITRTAEFSFTVETCLEVQYGDIEVVAVKMCRSLAAAQKWLEAMASRLRAAPPSHRAAPSARPSAMVLQAPNSPAKGTPSSRMA